MMFELSERDTVTLIGMGKSIYDWVNITHRDFDTQGEIWTINAGTALFRHDVVFDMHTPEWLKGRNVKRALKRREWLKQNGHDKPIVMPRADPDFPTSLTYPLRKVIETTNSCYFATGFSYPLAAAYCCNVKRLRLFGCDFSYDRDTATHPDEQGRACCEYWIGRLVEKGVRVEVTNNTHLLDMYARTRGHLYGYHERATFEYPANGGAGRFVGPDYADQ